MEIKTNDKFPGLTGYTGPARGYFSLLHHAGPLVEWSENVFERIDYIEKYKAQREHAIRKSHIVYLDPLEIPAIAKLKLLSEDYWAKRTNLDEHYATKRKLLGDDYWAKCATLDADHQAKAERLSDYYWAELLRLNHDYEAECQPLYDEIIRYLQPLIPDCPWNGKTIFTRKSESGEWY